MEELPHHDTICQVALSAAGLQLVSQERRASGTNFVYLCHTESPELSLRRVLVRIGRTSFFWTAQEAMAKFESEAEAMNFARKYAGDLIHVPRVLSVGVEPSSQTPYLCMEFVESAKTLRQQMREADFDTRAASVHLMRVVTHLCQLEPPFRNIGGFSNSPLWFDGPPVGPCADMDEFVRQMLAWSVQWLTDNGYPHVAEKLSNVRLPFMGSAQLVFRHGDLSIDNILVRPAGCEPRFCLIDWEWAGVFDARDVWLEARELMSALECENVWKQSVPFDFQVLDAYYDVKEVFMGAVWAATLTGDARDDEISFLEENLARRT